MYKRAQLKSTEELETTTPSNSQVKSPIKKVRKLRELDVTGEASNHSSNSLIIQSLANQSLSPNQGYWLGVGEKIGAILSRLKQRLRS